MAEIDIGRAIDSAQLVKTRSVAGLKFVQVWHGGTQVRVFHTETGKPQTWEETTVWHISDDKGRPVEREEIEHHIAMHFARIREEVSGDE